MLRICPTPIGNLSDITLRVLEALREADLIAAEDTRHTRKLLSHYGISKPLLSFHEHNEVKRIPELLERLRDGENIALVSDAGMPGISDPGYTVIRAALDAELPVEVLPGPSALDTALVASGFATDSFVFLGFLPRKKNDLEQLLRSIMNESRTCVVYESPHRLGRTLAAAAAILPGRNAAICREMTKRFEEIMRGPVDRLAADVPEKVRGEIVLVFEGARCSSEESARAAEQVAASVVAAVTQMLSAGVSARRASELLAPLSGLSQNRIYKMALKAKK